MKIFNLNLLVLLFSSNLILAMDPYDFGHKKIPAIIQETSDVFESVIKIDEYLHQSGLITKPFVARKTKDDNSYNKLVKTFKNEMRSKFASDLSDLNQEQLNKKLHKKHIRMHKNFTIIAKLIIAGANPNLVIATEIDEEEMTIKANTIFTELISGSSDNADLEKLITLSLIFGADANVKKLDWGQFAEKGYKTIIQSPLIRAVNVENPSPMIIEQLLYHGADVNVQDEQGNTPAHYTAKHNSVCALSILHKHGANINITNKQAQTPRNIALDVGRCSREYDEIIVILCLLSPDPSLPNSALS